MTGIDLINCVRQTEAIRDTPLVMVSASSFDRHQREAALQQVDGFLSKPININQLLTVIGTCLSLTWVYHNVPLPEATATNGTAMLPPPPDRLQVWLEMAAMGDLITIEMEAQRLAERVSEHTSFVEALCQLTAEMDTEGVIEFLKAYHHET